MGFIIPEKKPLRAQVIHSGEILRASAEDANLLLTEYLKPFGSGFGANLNSGWFTSAKPHRQFGFSFTFSVAATYVPENDRYFDIGNLELDQLQHLDGPAKTPTAFGNNTEGPELGVVITNPSSGREEQLYSFHMPQGTGYPYVPAPMAQFSIGLIKNSELTFRFTPTMNIDDQYEFNVRGLGLKLGLTEFMSGNQLLPIDISLQAGYMDLNARTDYNVQPVMHEDIYNPYPASNWDNQGIRYNTSAYTVNLLAGKQFPILSVFTGAGFQHSNTKIKTIGSYPVVVPRSPDEIQPGEPTRTINSIEEPVNIQLEGQNKFHVMGGLRFRIAFAVISASYTYSDYPTLNIGAGISIR